MCEAFPSGSARAGSGNQIRRTAREEEGRGGRWLKAHQPAVVPSLSGPIGLESKSASGAAATRLESVCRASVTNGVRSAASWQPAVDEICGPGGTVRDAAWHPTERW